MRFNKSNGVYRGNNNKNIIMPINNRGRFQTTNCSTARALINITFKVEVKVITGLVSVDSKTPIWLTALLIKQRQGVKAENVICEIHQRR